jgi:hypothetical protein
MKLNKILDLISKFIRDNVGGLWWFGQHYAPNISPNAYEQMEYYGISYQELIGAFNSPHIETGYKPGSTCGIADYYGKVVGAVYKKDDNDKTKWVIIACFGYHKKTTDIVTGRKYWQSWKYRQPRKWRK